MGFTKNENPDEIDNCSQQDAAATVYQEAHALVSKQVAELFKRELRSIKKMYIFEKIAEKAGYMEVWSPDRKKIHRISLGLVDRNHKMNLDESLENAKNYESLLKHLSKFFKYCEIVFNILKDVCDESVPEVKNWKLNIDDSNSTLYITESKQLRIGFVVQTINAKMSDSETPK